MVTEISPNYYASGFLKRDYTLHGVHFENIPAGAVGCFSVDNTRPTMFIDSTSDVDTAVITVISDTEATCTQAGSHTMTGASYLGCIVSADRQTIYWVNKTRPLP